MQKFKVLFNEKDFKAVAVDAYEAHLPRLNEPQSYINVLLHYIGEIGELSQCKRKGKGMAYTPHTKGFIENYDYFPTFPEDQKKSFKVGYRINVSGSMGDELADCFLVICVLMERLHREKGLKYCFHERIDDSMENDNLDFDRVLYWAIRSSTFNMSYLIEEFEDIETHGYLIMYRLMRMANNIQYIALYLEMDLSLFVFAKMAFNKLRND